MGKSIAGKPEGSHALFAASLLLLTACGVGEKSPAIITYACDNSIVATVAFSPARDLARLEIGSLSYDLKPIAAASGAKFSDGQVVYWSKGEEATISGINFDKPLTCKTRPGDAAP